MIVIKEVLKRLTLTASGQVLEKPLIAKPARTDDASVLATRVVTPNNSGARLCKNWPTLLPTNMTKSPYGEKVRAFSKLQGSGRAQRYLHPSCTYKLDGQYPLPNPSRPDLGEENDTVYGTDPVEIVNDC